MPKVLVAWLAGAIAVAPMRLGDGPLAPSIAAALSCPALEELGKVRCEAAVTASGGKVQWGDVLVVSAPDFAPPLRTRLGSADATRRTDESLVFALALLAKSPGRGELRVVARAVVCGDAACLPVTANATTEVSVGQSKAHP